MSAKTSLNLAYKIVNYVFDSEISQTAGAKEHKHTGSGEEWEKAHSDWQGHRRGCLSSTSSTLTTFIPV